MPRNRYGGKREVVRYAVHGLDDAGGAAGYLELLRGHAHPAIPVFFASP